MRDEVFYYVVAMVQSGDLAAKRIDVDELSHSATAEIFVANQESDGNMVIEGKVGRT